MGCGFAHKAEVLVTGTDLINLQLYFSRLFIAFSDINTSLARSIFTHEIISIIFGLYADFS